MKKLTSIVLLAAILIGTQTVTKAIQAQNIKEQKEINHKAAIQLRGKEKENAYEILAVEKFNALADRYYNNIRTCEPLHLSEYMDLFGLKIGLKVDINGWVDNKCAYYMTGKISGIGKDIREVFNVTIPDEQIAKIEPIIQCNFTQDQLNVIVDAIIARNAKTETQVSKMLENPAKKYKEDTKLTKEEEALVTMLVSGNACTIPNQEELMKNFSEVFMPKTAPAAAPVVPEAAPKTSPSGVNMPQAPAK